ncbi:retropepsin-like aspartic protease family protein [Nitrospira sp. M1]
MLSTLPPTFAATYRCEDSAGVTVLTDSPAQLEHCTVLFEDHSLPDQATNPHSGPALQPMSLLTQPNGKESPGQNQEYPFIDEPDKGSQGEPSNMVTIPVTSYGGSLLVTVQLNQTREVRLILDTGATMTVLSQDVALDLGLLSNTNTQLTTVQTAGGPIQVNVSTIRSIQAGTAEVHDVDVAIHDLPDSHTGVDGLLGMSFLNHFLVTLDTNQGVLHLKPRS